MEEGRHSATAEGCAVLRALHQLKAAEPRILDDPISPRLVDPDGAAYKTWSEFLERLPTANQLRLTHYLLRSRYAEDCLAEAFGRRPYCDSRKCNVRPCRFRENHREGCFARSRTRSDRICILFHAWREPVSHRGGTGRNLGHGSGDGTIE